MTTEQKAKAYDEALEWTRKVYPTLTGADKEDAEYYFPELKESEDERIRKAIVTLIEDLQHYSTNYAGVDPTDMLAWLEKQKEQKPGNNSIRGKIISRATSEKQVVLISESNGKAEIGWDTRSLEDTKKLLEYGLAFINRNITNPTEKQKEQKPSEWSEEDEHRCKDAIYFLETAKKHYADTSEIELTIEWLKSLRPQSKVEEEYIENRNDGFDAFMDGFNQGYELGIKEQTKKQ